jgi:hypothetical protein
MRTIIEAIIDNKLAHKAKFDTLGDIHELPHSEAVNNVARPLQPSDVVIFYDYCTDEASDQLTDEFIEWLWKYSYAGLDKIMASLGYTMIGENDGSGNGLYYGTLHYRKI